MAKKNTPTNSTPDSAPDAAPAGEPTSPVVSEPAPAAAQAETVPPAVQPRRRLGGLAIAGIATGAVLSAGLLFGGGVALGVALPDGRPGVDIQSGMPFDGEQGRPLQGGPGVEGPQLPGQRVPGQRDGSRDGSEGDESSTDSTDDSSEG